MQKPKKIRLVLTNMKYGDRLRESLDDVLPTLKSQTTSFAFTINCHYGIRKKLEMLTSSTPIIIYCYGFKEELEMEPIFITSTSFIDGSNISNVKTSNIELSEIDYTL